MLASSSGHITSCCSSLVIIRQDRQTPDQRFPLSAVVVVSIIIIVKLTVIVKHRVLVVTAEYEASAITLSLCSTGNISGT